MLNGQKTALFLPKSVLGLKSGAVGCLAAPHPPTATWQSPHVPPIPILPPPLERGGEGIPTLSSPLPLSALTLATRFSH